MKIIIFFCLVALGFSSPVKKYGNPDEWGNYYQGDIRLPLPLMNKNGLIDEKYRWPNGQMVFQFNDGAFTQAQKDEIQRGMDDYVASTNGCITFKLRDTEDNYVQFTNSNVEGCFSYVGMVGGLQRINYPDWCINQYGSILHEMLHAFGFYHQQSATNRDDYVTIMYENIEKGAENNFDKYPDTMITDFDVAYDYESVMHYSSYAFSANDQMTIVTKDPAYQNVIGQREGFSPGDLEKLLKMYNCPQ